MHHSLSSGLTVIQKIFAGCEANDIPASVFSVMADDVDVLTSVSQLLKDIAWLKEIDVDYRMPTLIDDTSGLEVLLAHFGSQIPEKGEIGYIPPGDSRDVLTKSLQEHPHLSRKVPSWLGGDLLVLNEARLKEIAEVIDDIGLEMLEVIPIPLLEDGGRTTHTLNEKLLFKQGIRIGQFLYDVRHAIARRNRIAAFLTK